MEKQTESPANNQPKTTKGVCDYCGRDKHAELDITMQMSGEGPVQAKLKVCKYCSALLGLLEEEFKERGAAVFVSLVMIVKEDSEKEVK